MRINRLTFLNALEKVKPGISIETTTKQSDCFCFSNGYIKTYNGEIATSVKYPIDIEGAVKATELYKLLSKFDEEEIKIFKMDNQFVIKGKRKRAGINLEEEILIPTPNFNEEIGWMSLPNNFLSSLKFAIFTAHKNNSNPLSSIVIEKDEILSCDNFRATKKKMDGEIKIPFLLPATVATYLIEYEGINQYSISDSWVHFLKDQTISGTTDTIGEENRNGILFSSRDMGKDTYNYFKEKKENILSLFETKGEKIILPDMANTIDRAMILAGTDKDNDKFITIILKNNKLICKGENNIGNYEEILEIEYDGKELKFLVSPIFLKEITSRVREVTIGSRLLFKGTGFQHVVCLVVCQ